MQDHIKTIRDFSNGQRVAQDAIIQYARNLPDVLEDGGNKAVAERLRYLFSELDRQREELVNKFQLDPDGMMAALLTRMGGK